MYKIRVFITSGNESIIMYNAIRTTLFLPSNHFKGKDGVLAIYDGRVSKNGLVMLISLGIKFFPLDNYGDFKITCPNCGERIDDDMIHHIYDDSLLSGYTIKCDRADCGMQQAVVEFLGD